MARGLSIEHKLQIVFMAPLSPTGRDSAALCGPLFFKRLRSSTQRTPLLTPVPCPVPGTISLSPQTNPSTIHTKPAQRGALMFPAVTEMLSGVLLWSEWLFI